MSKKIVLYIGTSLAIWVCTMLLNATFNRRPSQAEEAGTLLAVHHPDGCILLEPQPLPLSVGAANTLVKLKPGPNHFEFDCDGRQISVDHEVKPSEKVWTFEPGE